MISNKEIRTIARQELKGFWTMPVLATLVYIVIAVVLQTPSYFAKIPSLVIPMSTLTWVISILVVFPLAYGFTLAFLHFLREDKEDTVEAMFCGFKTYGRAIGVYLLETVLLFLWFLLLFVPGIIKSLAYSLTFFISKDHPELSAYECIQRSNDMMKGHKMQLFLLYLGFFGLAILSVFTLFIGMLWLTPFFQVCLAEFYENLKEEEDMKLAEAESALLSEESTPVVAETMPADMTAAEEVCGEE